MSARRARRARVTVGYCPPISEMCREMWPGPLARPWWAKLAHRRRWISSAEYYEIPVEPNPEDPMSEALFEPYPLL